MAANWWTGVSSRRYQKKIAGICSHMLKKRSEDYFEDLSDVEEYLDDRIYEQLISESAACLALFFSDNRLAWVGKVGTPDLEDTCEPFRLMAYYAMRKDIVVAVESSSNWKLKLYDKE